MVDFLMMGIGIVEQFNGEWLAAIFSKLPRIQLNVDLSPMAQSKKSFDWVPFGSAALGGMASIIASVVAFKLSNASNISSKKEDDKKAAAAHAMSGYFKLIQCVNTFSNIKLHIDDSFSEAHRAGVKADEACQYVGPSAGRFVEPERLKAEEFSFLLAGNKVETINNIGVIENRAINSLELLAKYSTLRADLQIWVDEIPGLKREINGASAVDTIPIEYKTRLDSRIVQLNLLLWGIIEDIENDRDLAIKTIQEFIDYAHEFYDPYFPRINMATKEPDRPTVVVFSKEPFLF